MTQGQKVAALYAVAVPAVVVLYFLTSPDLRSNPYYTRAYFWSIGLSLGAGFIGYWFERKERGDT